MAQRREVSPRREQANDDDREVHDVIPIRSPPASTGELCNEARCTHQGQYADVASDLGQVVVNEESWLVQCSVAPHDVGQHEQTRPTHRQTAGAEELVRQSRSLRDVDERPTGQQLRETDQRTPRTVSYTHLTLPTK